MVVSAVLGRPLDDQFDGSLWLRVEETLIQGLLLLLLNAEAALLFACPNLCTKS